MPAVVKKMGKAAASPFGAITKSTPEKKSKLPILILIVVGGVVVIWYLRNHSSANTVGSSSTATAPAVSINGGNAPDQSSIDNLTASVLALQGLQNGNSSIPSGGASTPITVQPSTTNPNAAANAAGVPDAYNPANTSAQYQANPNLAYQNPQDLLSQIQAANAAGKTMVQLPSGELWATNQATIDQIKANITSMNTPKVSARNQ